MFLLTLAILDNLGAIVVIAVFYTAQVRDPRDAAGVALAFFIPIRTDDPQRRSPLRELEHDSHPVVACGIMPLFAFANAGVSTHGMSLGSLLDPVPLGIAVGLLAGKTIGVFATSAAAIGLGMARMPQEATWSSLFGVSILCGIGFTMSLFIANLACAEETPDLAVSAVVGILAASLAAAVASYVLLAVVLAGRPPQTDERPTR